MDTAEQVDDGYGTAASNPARHGRAISVLGGETPGERANRWYSALLVSVVECEMGSIGYVSIGTEVAGW